MTSKKRKFIIFTLPLIVILMLFLPSVLGWYSANYTYKMPINTSLVGSGTQLVLNGSLGFSITGCGNPQIIWFRVGSNSATYQLYFNNCSAYTLVENDTTKISYDIEIGNILSNNPTGVWIPEFKHIYHGNSLNDVFGTNNLTQIGTTNSLLITNGNCRVGGCFGVNSSGYFYSNGATGLAVGMQDGSTYSWIKAPTDIAGYTMSNGGWGGTAYRSQYEATTGLSFIYDMGGTQCIITTGVDMRNTWVQSLLTITQGYFYGFLNNTYNCTKVISVNTGANNIDIGGIQGFMPWITASNLGYIDEVRYGNVTLNSKYANDTYYNMQSFNGYGMLGLTESNCVSDWECSDYDALNCTIENETACLNVTDSNNCGEEFSGNLTDYNIPCIFCESLWNCTGYLECGVNNQSNCTDVEDLNNCGFGFNYEFLPLYNLNCTYCLPSWSCTDYDCQINNISLCLAVGDLNLCNVSFVGNLTDYDSVCNYTYATIPSGSWLDFNLNNQSSILLFGVFVILWLGLAMLTFTFRNTAFGGIMFFVGVALGFMTISVSWIISAAFLFFSALLMMRSAKF